MLRAFVFITHYKSITNKIKQKKKRKHNFYIKQYFYLIISFWLLDIFYSFTRKYRTNNQREMKKSIESIIYFLSLASGCCKEGRNFIINGFLFNVKFYCLSSLIQQQQQ